MMKRLPSTLRGASGAFCLLLTFCLITSTKAAERTSENNFRLKHALTRFPEADTNGDHVLTQSEAQAFFRLRSERRRDRIQRPSGIKPTHSNVAYGPHERHSLDLWLAESDQPTPLVIHIHGGGFRNGSKELIRASLIDDFRYAGISVAAINYRLTENGKHPFPAPMHDAARAVQYLRLHAEDYNLDKKRFACMGGSAGACMSLWLAMHDDLADPDSDDPVLRESTRITVAGSSNGQSTLDMQTFEQWFGVEHLEPDAALVPFYNLQEDEDAETPRVRKLMVEASPITHLTKDDPPVFAVYRGRDVPVTKDSPSGLWVHHPRLGIKLQEAMKKLGIPCHVQYPGGPPVDGGLSQTEFIIQQLKK